MGGEQRVRYMVIERYAHGRRRGRGHRVSLFETAEEAHAECRALERRSAAVGAELIQVDPAGRLATLWSSS
ncbi:MAG: hypothetical protein M3326_07180 [Actinomycetota bacterium]|nr:hypothetical protein [Actinomycetota bacterium]